MWLTWAGVRRSISRIAPVVLLTAVLAGCHVPGTGASGPASSGSITVAAVPGIDNAPLRVGTQDGLFQQHGLTVTVRDYPSLDAEFQALSDGQVQIAVGDYTGFLYEQATRHAALSLVADGYDAAPNSVAILALPGSGITTPQELEKLGVPVGTAPAQLSPGLKTVPYNVETLAAEEVMQNDGVSPSSVNWTAVQPQDMIQALHTGQVKAILATEPYILQAQEQLGAIEVMDASTGVTSGLPLSGYFSLASYPRANPSVVQAFQAALDQAQTDCAQRGAVQAVLPQLTGMSTGDAAQITLGTYPESVNAGQVQRVATLMYDSGMIGSQVSVATNPAGVGLLTTQ